MAFTPMNQVSLIFLYLYSVLSASTTLSYTIKSDGLIQNSPFTFDEFKKITKKVFDFEFKCHPATDPGTLDVILQAIWIKLCKEDKNRLALFVASSIHNTSYYKIFESSGRDMYKSRGLVSIQCADNYKLLTKISENNIDYLTNPHLLAERSPQAYNVSIDLWLRICDNVQTFEDMLKALGIGDYDELKNNRGDLVEWKKIYKKLLNAYNN